MKVLVAGAGIGGLAAALNLHAAGWHDITVLESAREIQQVGVGLNLPPHAVRELVELGLGDALAAAGWPTAELSYHDAQGALIWAEPRGLAAGYRWPQYSIHRGRLQQLLLDAVRERLGAQAVVTGQRVQDVQQAGARVQVQAVDARTGASVQYEGDLLLATDGIRSAVRQAVLGPIPLATNGWTMYRGAARARPFRTGHTMVIVGDEHQRAVVYPIDGETLNWLIVRPAHAAGAIELGNWNRPIAPSDVAQHVRHWAFDWLDIPALVEATHEAYEYPMADIDPLAQWTVGRVTLLGDAAHAMYPFGSNGASQAILDGRVLAFELARHGTVEAGLAAYEQARRPAVSSVQLANRSQAGDVMARVSAMARSRDHASAATELKEVEQKYKRLAGFDVSTLNERPSFDVPPAADGRSAFQ
jgi:2-polyprenyl-6-methoxyphenol hydroxylase-like FAD-dependent oxidoreductase